MKLALIAFVTLALPASATLLGITSVKQATYLHGGDSDSIIRIIDVPFVTSYSDPEWRFSAICKPFVPATDGSWQQPRDVNLASLYGITVSGGQKPSSSDVEVVVDASKAKVPEGYPFTIAQVTDAVVTCVKLMYPTQPEKEGKFIIRVCEPTTNAQQGVDGKPPEAPQPPR